MPRTKKPDLELMHELGHTLLDEVLAIDEDAMALSESVDLDEAADYLDRLDARVQNCLVYINRLRRRGL